jgi:hypothetical protein
MGRGGGTGVTLVLKPKLTAKGLALVYLKSI